MAADSQTITQIKAWLFPTLIAILGTIIWNDVKEIKNDVKALMAQSNIDKTRIDNLEKRMDFFRSGAASPTSLSETRFPTTPGPIPKEAILAKDLYIDTRQKKILATYVKRKGIPTV